MSVQRKWMIYMFPGLIMTCFLTYLFHPTSNELFNQLPIFLLLQLATLVIYHLVIIPKEIRQHLLNKFPFKNSNDLTQYEDIIDEIIQVSKLRQAEFKSYTREQLTNLLLTATMKKQTVSDFVKLLKIICVASVVLTIIYIVIYFPLGIIQMYILWAIALLFFLLFYILAKRKYQWTTQEVTLHRCIEKCNDSDIFIFEEKL